jgi:hypothetical protein
MSELIYGSDVFTLSPTNPSISLSTIFNSSDFNAGGDFLGPMVPAAASTDSPNQTVTPSTVGVEWKGHSSDLTTNCVYHYSMRYGGPESVSFSLIFFVNG